MVTELKTDYTETKSSGKPTNLNDFVLINANSSWGYTRTSVLLLVPNFTSVSPHAKKRIPAPAPLKKAMFRMSSKAIAKVLK